MNSPRFPSRPLALLPALVCLLLTLPSNAGAQVSLSALNTPASENFTAYSGAGFSPAGMGGRLDSDNWTVRGVSDGDLAFGANANMGDYARGTSTGGVTEGGVYAFDISGNPALGAQGTDTDFAPGELVWRVQNDTGQPISQLTLSWTVLSWNDQDGSSTVTVEVWDGTRTVVLPDVVTTTDLADMAPAWSSTSVSVPAVDNLLVLDGATLEVRFIFEEVGNTGIRDEMAIDDLSIAATANAATCSMDTDCDDAVVCNGAETCPAGVCVPGTFAMAGTTCGDQSTSACDGADTCDGSGVCNQNLLAPGTPCPDGVFCNGEETCDGNGTCTPGMPVDPDDGISCTTDSCDEMGMEVVNNPDDSVCNDMDDCTLDVCGTETGCVNLSGCVIEEMCVLPGARNSQNFCQICDPVEATDAWTDLPVGAICVQAQCNQEGNAQPEATCDEAGFCRVQEPEVCPNGCEAAMCLAPCQSDDDCPDEAWCDLEVGGGCTFRNRIPIADAGMDQTVTEGDTVTLDGRSSVDPDGEPIDFAWTQLEGPEVTLSSPTTPTVTFTAPRVQQDSTELRFRLQVSDGTDYSQAVFTTVTVSNTIDNSTPVAVIEGPEEADAGTTITLLADMSSDPDGDPLSWTWSQESGPQAMLRGTETNELVITLPEAPGERMVFGLIVNDGLTNSELTTHQVAISGQPMEPQPEQTDVSTDAGVDATPSFDSGGNLNSGSCECATTRGSGRGAPLPLIALVGIVVLYRRRYSVR